MQIKLTAKRQATFPVEVCNAMKLKPGDRIDLVPGNRADEWIIRPIRIQLEKLAPLKGKLSRGVGSFNLTKFRAEVKDYDSLRD